MGPRTASAAGALLCLLAWGGAAPAFTIDDVFHVLGPGPCPPFQPTRCLDVEATLSQAPRWSASPVSGAGLHDGVQVNVAPGFAAALAPDPAETPRYEAAVLEAFAAWETPELHFDVTLDGPARHGTFSGAEIDLFALPGDDPIFDGLLFSGVTFFDADWSPLRTLTTGEPLPGFAMMGVDIYINIDRFAFVFDLLVAAGVIDPQDHLARLTNLLLHEIGHGVGLEHPDEFGYANLDDDADPSTEVVVDPLDPFAGLFPSASFDFRAIMTSGLSPVPEALLFTELQADDRSGLHVLYPSLPEPGSLALLATGLLALARGAARSSRSGPAPGRTTRAGRGRS